MSKRALIAAAAAALFFAQCRVSGRGTSTYEKQAAFLSQEGYYPASTQAKETLVSGEKLVLDAELKGGSCYAFLVTKESGTAVLHFSLGLGGNVIDEKVESSRPFSVITHCPEADGRYRLHVMLKGGDSGVMVGVWKKGTPGGGAAGGGCDNPIDLDPGKEISGTTAGMASLLQGSCIQGKAPETVYRVTAKEPLSFTADLQAAFDGGLYLLDACGPEAQELACNDDYEMKSGVSKISVSLDSGVYYLVVDGFGTKGGEYKLRSSVIPRAEPGELCAGAPSLQPGGTVKGKTSGKPDTFHASCAEGARGPDQVYRVEVKEQTRARFFLETPAFDGVVHLHKGCPGESTEIACNDDFEGNQNAMIMADLQPGTYAVVVDGFDGMEAGAYTLRMDAQPASAARPQDDACEGAAAVGLDPKADDQVAAVDGSTFWADDSAQPSCADAPGGPDVFRKFHVGEPSLVSMAMKSSQFPGIILSLSGGCKGKELACQIEGIETALPAGDYVLGIDSLGADQLGDFRLEVRVQKLAALKKICAAGGKLEDGKTLKGKTAGKGGFAGSCGGLGYGPENVYILTMVKPGSVRIEVNPEGFDSVIYIRKSCTEKASEAACNDDAGSTKQSILEAELDKGTYYIFVDGCKEKDSGNYTIRAIIK